VFNLAPGAPDTPTIVARGREQGLLILAFGPRTVRAVTHLGEAAAVRERRDRSLGSIDAGASVEAIRSQRAALEREIARLQG
jgi:hypothetical protein